MTPPPPRRRSALLLDESPLVVQPGLVRALGRSHLAALFVQQLHYWLQRSDNFRDGCYWTYQTYDEWSEQLVSTPSTMYRLVQKLEAQGLIRTTSAYNRLPADNTLWYTLNYDALDQRLAASDPSHGIVRRSMQNDERESATCLDGVSKMTRAIPETPSETPSEIPSPVVEVGEGPAVRPPPPPPPQLLCTNDDREPPSAAPDLVALAVAQYQELYRPRAPAAQARRIQRDVARLLADHIPLTARGLEHALNEAAGKNDAWEFALKVWRAKPDGPPQGATHVHLETRPGIVEGHPGSVEATPRDPVAEQAKLRAALADLVPRGAGRPPG